MIMEDPTVSERTTKGLEPRAGPALSIVAHSSPCYIPRGITYGPLLDYTQRLASWN